MNRGKEMTNARAELIRRTWKRSRGLWDVKLHGPIFRVPVVSDNKWVWLTEDDAIKPIPFPVIEYRLARWYEPGAGYVYQIKGEGLVVEAGRYNERSVWSTA